MTNEFDIEAQVSIHARTLAFLRIQVESDCLERPQNSLSQLSIVKDGLKIRLNIVRLLKETRSLFFSE
jgi:hypothetical protein